MGTGSTVDAMVSDTPRTDAMSSKINICDRDMANLLLICSRELERELAIANVSLAVAEARLNGEINRRHATGLFIALDERRRSGDE